MRASRTIVAAMMLLLCACGGSGGDGSSTPGEAACEGPSCGSPTEPPAASLLCNSRNAAQCPQGYRCVDDRADSCDPATGGVDCGGVCVLGEELPGCGMTQEPCPSGSVCVDDPTDACDGGPATDCPGLCRPEANGQCTVDADCPALPAVCETCADGSFSCASTRCDEGTCIVDVKPCPGPTACGGIGGLPCEPGLRCIDDPVDECEPERGDADCSGICVPGEEPLRCGGFSGATCPDGLSCVDDPTDTCDPLNGGADCPGLCEPGSSEECQTDADCPPLRAPCQVCADGTEVCPRSFCDNGHCSKDLPTCAPVVICGDDGSGCNPGENCVDDPDDTCDPAAGATGCKGLCVPVEIPRCGAEPGDTCPPGHQCVDPSGTVCDPNSAGSGCAGICVPAPAGCQTESDCDHVLIIQGCVQCPDSSYWSCARAECRDGVCAAGFDACPTPDFCGGIAGFPCPPGLTCIDAPNDECDPLRGGADCAGICVREEKPATCGGIAGTPCPEGYECADDPGDDCDPNAGGSDCAGICRPAPMPPCSSDAECPQIGAPCRICADGTAACPRSLCVNGACHVDFAACAAEQ